MDVILQQQQQPVAAFDPQCGPTSTMQMAFSGSLAPATANRSQRRHSPLLFELLPLPLLLLPRGERDEREEAAPRTRSARGASRRETSLSADVPSSSGELR